MTTIVTRAGKGSPLTHTEVDTNFTNLNTNKLETAAIPLGTAAAPSISFLSDANTGIYSPGADQLAVATNGTERARIDSSGRLLVGTSTARTIFENGTANARVQVEGTDNSTSRLTVIRNGGGGGITLAGTAGASVGSIDAVANNATVGEIAFAGSDGTDFVNAANISAHVDGTPGANDMPGRLVFSTTADGASSPAERMRINSAGHTKFTTDGAYTGIDANTHGFRQTVTANWTLFCTNSSAAPVGIVMDYTGATPNNTSSFFLYCSDSTAVRANIRSNGGLANFQSNDVNLSDRNVKKDISPAANTWNCIKEWEIVNYRYKDQPDDANLNVGVIAQQIAESCPEVITIFQEAKDATEDKPAQEERLGVREQQMYWMAIKALQEAMGRIEQLEAKVAALESA